jgi:hypothetical protein
VRKVFLISDISLSNLFYCSSSFKNTLPLLTTRSIVLFLPVIGLGNRSSLISVSGLPNVRNSNRSD